MDLSNFRQQDTAEHTLVTPSGEKTDVIFTLAGQTHPERSAFEKKVMQKGLRDFNRRGKASLPDSADDIREQQIDRLTAFTLGWKNMQMSGQPYDFSEANARKLYSDPYYAWIRDQIDEALRSAENFIKPQSTT